jgi:hypothetical protein
MGFLESYQLVALLKMYLRGTLKVHYRVHGSPPLDS